MVTNLNGEISKGRVVYIEILNAGSIKTGNLVIGQFIKKLSKFLRLEFLILTGKEKWCFDGQSFSKAHSRI